LTDWLSKIFSSIVSVKTAFIAVLACCGMLLTWKIGVSFIDDRDLPQNLSPLIFIILHYGVSKIIVEVVVKLWSKGSELVSIWEKNKKVKKEQDTFIVEAEKTIPLLPTEQLKLLRMLSEQEQTFDITKDGAFYLEKQKYIKKVYKVSSRVFVFEIDLAIKQIVLSHLCALREQSILNFISDLTSNERQFLSLFFSETVSEGTQESAVKMGFGVFRSGVAMSRSGYLDHFATATQTSNVESFRLLQDTAKLLTDKVFNRRPQRNELHLNANYIMGSGASGGGAVVGSRYP